MKKLFIIGIITVLYYRNRLSFDIISRFSPPPHRACDFHRTRRSIVSLNSPFTSHFRVLFTLIHWLITYTFMSVPLFGLLNIQCKVMCRNYQCNDLCPFLHFPLQKISSVRTLLFSTDSVAYCSSSTYIPVLGYSIPFLVPLILSLHILFQVSAISLSDSYTPAVYKAFHSCRFLLCLTDIPFGEIPCFHVSSVQTRTFADSSVLSHHSDHERFIDSRHIISHIDCDKFSSRRVLTTCVPTILACFINLGTLSADFTELRTHQVSLIYARRSIRDSPSKGLPGKFQPYHLTV